LARLIAARLSLIVLSIVTLADRVRRTGLIHSLLVNTGRLSSLVDAIQYSRQFGLSHSRDRQASAHLDERQGYTDALHAHLREQIDDLLVI
jgi:hypothetical protein